MRTDTGTTAVGTIVETIGAATNGVEISGVESKPAGKRNAIVIGSATTAIVPWGTATTTIAATIVAKSVRFQACLKAPSNDGVNPDNSSLRTKAPRRCCL
ncbi:hypothetical protein PMHK_14580 [Pseudomonas sp. MHK4]